MKIKLALSKQFKSVYLVLFFVVLLLVILCSFVSSGYPQDVPGQMPSSAGNSFLFVFDLDRLFIKQKAQVMQGSDPQEYIQVGEDLYRIAAFTPEFLLALRFHFSKILQAPIHLANFSTGSYQRHLSVINSVKISRNLGLSDLISEVRSFEDLTPVKKLPPHVTKEQALAYIRSLRVGGKDLISFFELLAKDLRVMNHPLERVLIFEDSWNATPVNQTENLILIARPDLDESRLSLSLRGSKKDIKTLQVEEGQRDPVQIARTRYRLVRSVGTLSEAIKLYKRGDYATLPQALQALQWDLRKGGQFRSQEVNKEHNYREGMRILKQIYDTYIHPDVPRWQRPKEYFMFKPIIPRRNDCSDFMIHSRGVLPWSS